jgi:Ca2+-binding EF-hand superfamily protein
MKCPDTNIMSDYVANESLFKQISFDVAEHIIHAVAESLSITPMRIVDFNEITNHIRSCSECMKNYEEMKKQFNILTDDQHISLPI